MVMRGCACCVAQGPSRRAFLTAAAGAALALGPASAQAPRRIDVHHHLAPPRWIAEVVRGRNTGQRPLADWTPQRSLDDMDRAGVATAIVSISEPSVWFGDDAAARALARECNDYGARLAADHPGRFGQFAILPLPDVAGSLREIDYALDTLKADGICLMTSYHTAQAAHPYALSSLLELVTPRQVVFGTDFPFVGAAATAQGLADFGLGAGDLALIERDNAAALLPRLRAG